MSEWRRTLETIHRTATARGREQSGLTSLEGIRLVERAMRAGIPVPHALISQRLRDATDKRIQALIGALKAANCEMETAPDDVIEELTHGRGLGDILAVIPLPSQADLGALVRQHEAPLFLGAVDVVDAGNVGALVRTAHGLGANAFLAIGRCDPFHPRAVRTAMGSLFKLPVAHFPDMAGLAGALESLNTSLVGAVSSGGIPLPDLRLGSDSVAVVVGSEYHGFSAHESALLDVCVTIPMPSGIDSLSVNAAAAVLLYEAGRQLKDRLTCPGDQEGT